MWQLQYTINGPLLEGGGIDAHRAKNVVINQKKTLPLEIRRLDFGNMKTLLLSLSLLSLAVIPASATGNAARAKTIQDVAKGVMMRQGVVYPIHITVGKALVNGNWIATDNPMYQGSNFLANDPDWNQLVTDLSAGDPIAMANLRNYLSDYVGDPNRVTSLVNILNDVLENPGNYAISADDARALLGETFDSFLLTDAEFRPPLDFSQISLAGKDLTWKDLRNTGITGNQLASAEDLTGANLDGLDLSSLDFSEKMIAAASFDGANLNDTDFGTQNLDNLNFANANLANANLAGTSTNGTNLAGANLEGSNITKGQIESAGDNLDGTNLSGHDLSGADLRGKSMNGTILTGANLAGTLMPNPYYVNCDKNLNGIPDWQDPAWTGPQYWL